MPMFCIFTILLVLFYQQYISPIPAVLILNRTEQDCTGSAAIKLHKGVQAKNLVNENQTIR